MSLLPLPRINSNRHGFEVLDVSLVNQDSSQPVTDKLPLSRASMTFYTIFILRNYSDKSFTDIAHAISQFAIMKAHFETCLPYNTVECGVAFLTAKADFTWHSCVRELLGVFTEFPKVCFCLLVSKDDSDCRVLFFNGERIEQTLLTNKQ